MYACPWCKKKAFSFWQKQSLGPTRSIACGACTRRVSVPWLRANLAAVPVVLLGMVGVTTGKLYGTMPEIFAYGLAGVFVGMLITGPIYHLFVPLVRPES
jgi:hypothetical protein